jgi:peptidoglycan hydrolase CwlO-like protein
MPTEIVRHLSLEEQELARKRQELAILQAELTDRELSLANLHAELAAFEGRYLREVGILYAELDDWNAKIAEFAAESAGTEQARAAASEARAQADESYAAAHGAAAKAEDFSPSPELRKLFRDVVNQIHPDRAANEIDRALRNRLMAQANLAYRRQDADTLRKILDEYKTSPESVKGDGAAADLQRILLQIRQISKRLVEIQTEVAELTASEIAILMAKVEIAAAKGRNLVAEMKKDVQHRIDLARKEFADQASRIRPN